MSKSQKENQKESYRPNAPTVFINKSVVINDNWDVMNGGGFNDGQVRRPANRNNQVAITVQSADNDLLKEVEVAVMDVINVYNQS